MRKEKKELKKALGRVMTQNQRLVRRLHARENSIRKINSKAIVNSLKVFFGADPNINRQVLLEAGRSIEEVKSVMVEVAAKSGQILSTARTVEGSLHSLRVAQEAGGVNTAGSWGWTCWPAASPPGTHQHGTKQLPVWCHVLI